MKMFVPWEYSTTAVCVVSLVFDRVKSVHVRIHILLTGSETIRPGRIQFISSKIRWLSHTLRTANNHLPYRSLPHFSHCLEATWMSTDNVGWGKVQLL